LKRKLKFKERNNNFFLKQNNKKATPWSGFFLVWMLKSQTTNKE